MRTGGQVLVDQLLIQGVQHIFCVPGESYLAALDAMYGSKLNLTVCRQEGGAAMMAEAYGKLTGRPGICFVTRGPGATNASPGLHIAAQDSTPMILFIGQVERGMQEREAFQELDYRAVFGGVAKWVVEIQDAARIPELISRAFHVAVNGRPGPVVVVLPEDVLGDHVACSDAAPALVAETLPRPEDVAVLEAMLAASHRPLIIAGGSRWDPAATKRLSAFALRYELPVAVSFRRQSLFPGNHPNYIGDLGFGSNPALIKAARESDLVLLLGTRLSEAASQGYTLLDIPKPTQTMVHVHPGVEELGKVYHADLIFNVSPRSFLDAFVENKPAAPPGRTSYIAELHKNYRAWSEKPGLVPGSFNLGIVVSKLSANLPPNAVITTGAGNYATWVNRFFRVQELGSFLAPTCGSMGYGVPAAVGAARQDPARAVIAFAGDGCFLMNGQEFATAVQYGLPIIVVIVDNGMYGTIRMHQELNYPSRVIGTELRNPDFTAYARAFGGYGERVERTEDFMPAFDRAVASRLPAILHCVTDPEALTPDRSLTEIRRQAERGRETTA